MTDVDRIFIWIGLVVLAYILGQLRLVVRRLREDVASLKREFPNCDHKDWTIDRQLKIMWCEQCKRGQWYNIGSLEGKGLSVKSEKAKYN